MVFSFEKIYITGQTGNREIKISKARRLPFLMILNYQLRIIDTKKPFVETCLIKLSLYVRSAPKSNAKLCAEKSEWYTLLVRSEKLANSQYSLMRKTTTVNQKRPVNLDLSSLKYPPMAIVSILHRISGLVLFLLLPMMLYFLSLSLRSAASFDDLQTILACAYTKLLLWVFSSALIYHVMAGIRHMLMDLGWGEQLVTGRRSAVTLIILSIILTVLLGVWIW